MEGGCIQGSQGSSLRIGKYTPSGACGDYLDAAWVNGHPHGPGTQVSPLYPQQIPTSTLAAAPFGRLVEGFAPRVQQLFGPACRTPHGPRTLVWTHRVRMNGNQGNGTQVPANIVWSVYCRLAGAAPPPPRLWAGTCPCSEGACPLPYQ